MRTRVIVRVKDDVFFEKGLVELGANEEGIMMVFNNKGFEIILVESLRLSDPYEKEKPALIRKRMPDESDVQVPGLKQIVGGGIYKITDDVLPKLQLNPFIPIQVTITEESVYLNIGPRDFQWEKASGRFIGSGCKMEGLNVTKKQNFPDLFMSFVDRACKDESDMYNGDGKCVAELKSCCDNIRNRTLQLLTTQIP